MSVLGHDELLPGTKLCFMVHAIAFQVPIMADYAQMLNAKSVSAAGVCAQLTTRGNDGKGAGNLVAISIGGGQEAGLARPHSMDLVIKCRKGFVKQAIETGASIIPMISFGENELMDLVTDDSGWIAWCMRMGFTMLYKTENQKDIKLHQGISGLPLIAPFRKPINLVLVHPIHVKKQAEPSADYVTEVHKRYMRELKQFWDDWRDTFGIKPSVEFNIVEWNICKMVRLFG
jgi:2-acylglycerol O-acyltransferase 1